MRNAILIPGLAAGAVLALVLYLSMKNGTELDYTTAELIGYSAMLLLLFAGQTVTQLQSRRKYPAAFGTRFSASMATSAVAAAVAAVFSWVYFAWLEPDYLQRFFEYYVEQMRANAESALAFEQQLTALNQSKDFFLNPVSQAVVLFGTILMIGILLSPVTAWLFRPRAKASL